MACVPCWMRRDDQRWRCWCAVCATYQSKLQSIVGRVPCERRCSGRRWLASQVGLISLHNKGGKYWKCRRKLAATQFVAFFYCELCESIVFCAHTMQYACSVYRHCTIRRLLILAICLRFVAEHFAHSHAIWFTFIRALFSKLVVYVADCSMLNGLLDIWALGIWITLAEPGSTVTRFHIRWK